jgi:hypothetical protein
MSDDRKLESAQNDEKQGQDPQPLRIEEASDEAPARRVRGSGGASDDEEDETWTNQPSSSSGEDREEFEQDVDDDLDEQEVEQARAPRRAIQNGRDVLCEELPDRAQRAAIRLKPFLTGVLVVELTNSGERFVFDWRSDTPKTTPINKDVVVSIDEQAAPTVSDDRVQADACISISEQHLMSIRAGDLNPQIGMLTEKIRVRGKVSPAVYLFNLVAPRARP